MKPQYVFSLLAIAATAALFWNPKPPSPLTHTREEDGFEVRITKHPEPHLFEELPVPSLENPDPTVFQLPRSYIRNRLCAGDDVMLAAVQTRLLLTPGEGRAFGALAAGCANDAPFCARAAAALNEDAGPVVDELQFFAEALANCDPSRLASLRMDLRFPLDVRIHAWVLLPDAGAWSPGLAAVIDEQLAHEDAGMPRIGTSSLVVATAAVREDSPELLAASVRLMDAHPSYARLLRRAAAPSVRGLACARLGCDAGVNEPEDAGIDERETSAACALQNENDLRCLDRLAMLDWSIARGVALRTSSRALWGPALRAFETREAFEAFARSISASPQADGGFAPDLLEGTPTRESRWWPSSRDGLGHDELAAQWATQAPELKGAFFVETGEPDGGVRVFSYLSDEVFSLGVRHETKTLDGRAVLALLNAVLAEQGSSRRFFFVKSGWLPTVVFAEPARISTLVERKLVVLHDPDAERLQDL